MNALGNVWDLAILARFPQKCCWRGLHSSCPFTRASHVFPSHPCSCHALGSDCPESLTCPICLVPVGPWVVNLSQDRALPLTSIHVDDLEPHCLRSSEGEHYLQDAKGCGFSPSHGLGTLRLAMIWNTSGSLHRPSFWIPFKMLLVCGIQAIKPSECYSCPESPPICGECNLSPQSLQPLSAPFPPTLQEVTATYFAQEALHPLRQNRLWTWARGDSDRFTDFRFHSLIPAGRRPASVCLSQLHAVLNRDAQANAGAGEIPGAAGPPFQISMRCTKAWLGNCDNHRACSSSVPSSTIWWTRWRWSLTVAPVLAFCSIIRNWKLLYDVKKESPHVPVPHHTSLYVRGTSSRQLFSKVLPPSRQPLSFVIQSLHILLLYIFG